jgi:hypothetical protein
VSIICLTVIQAIGGKFPCFLRLLFYILVAGIYETKKVKKCLQFVYIFADLLPVKCQTKFLILAVKCLTNCLLQQSTFLKIVCSIVWKNNCLTRIQTFPRLFEPYCLYNRMKKYTFLPNICWTKIQTFHRSLYCLYNGMEKYTFFADKLFDKNSNFPQAS